MMRIFLPLMCLVSMALGLDLQCYSVKPRNWAIIGTVPTCEAKEVEVTEKRQVLSNADPLVTFKALRIRFQKCPYVPVLGDVNLAQKLQSIVIYQSHLKEIERQDLEQFPELVILSLSYNELAVLGSDLFASSPKLQFINMRGNDLKIVGENLLEPLKNLHRVWFGQSGCIDWKDATTPKEIAELKTQLLEKCSKKEEPLTPEKENELLKQKVETLEKEKLNLEQARSEVEKDKLVLERGKAEMEQVKAEVEKEKIEIDQSRHEVEEKKKEIEQKRVHVEQAKVDLASKQVELFKEKAEVEAEKAKVEAEKVELSNLKAELDGQKAELEMPKAELEMTKAELQRTIAEQENLKAELQRTKAELEASKSSPPVDEEKMKIEINHLRETSANLENALTTEKLTSRKFFTCDKNIESATKILAMMIDQGEPASNETNEETLLCSNYIEEVKICVAHDFKISDFITAISSVEDDQGVKVTPTSVVIRLQALLFLPVNLGEALPGIQHLELSDSSVFIIDRKAFSGLGELLSLNLTRNKIHDIPQGAFVDLVKLTTLDMSSNRIEVIGPGTFEGAEALKILNLSDNVIKKVDESFLSLLQSLDFIDFTANICIHMTSAETSKEEIKTRLSEICVEMHPERDDVMRSERLARFFD